MVGPVHSVQYGKNYNLNVNIFFLFVNFKSIFFKESRLLFPCHIAPPQPLIGSSEKSAAELTEKSWKLSLGWSIKKSANKKEKKNVNVLSSLNFFFHTGQWKQNEL